MGSQEGEKGIWKCIMKQREDRQADAVLVVFIVAVLGELTVTVERHRQTSNHGRRGWFIFVS